MSEKWVKLPSVYCVVELVEGYSKRLKYVKQFNANASEYKRRVNFWSTGNMMEKKQTETILPIHFSENSNRNFLKIVGQTG